VLSVTLYMTHPKGGQSWLPSDQAVIAMSNLGTKPHPGTQVVADAAAMCLVTAQVGTSK
jgi:hypothetical protein